MHRRASLVLLNALSLSRLPLAAVFIVVSDSRLRALLVVLAAATDFLDGWIARHRGLATRWGALIDPVADRAFMVTAFLVCLLDGLIGPVELTLLLLRDIGTAIGFIVARLRPDMRAIELKARMLGKLVTTLQLAVLLCVLLYPPLVRPLVALVCLLSLASVVDYTRAVWGQRQRQQRPPSPPLGAPMGSVRK
ncbi:CDP-alcohol phosphatidyltransferase family protein [Corallococcus sp. BB11-1]|uniref:CDP-alcohol phosphatidyltransferase family protein n=1 Tax=Corallococcus sp. BB11-1 TaxID=2996783 RepID=UPI0010EB97A0|nr:CDP-alcohol phosphatidyltransferase family protein [Corallococcus sp. BB11-1]MCY1030101.1 CDP-alcohol phosphatidyltransferase family protein [Corallococcus sp. BB11-1]RYZ39544.1 MAG: CDP-alcohol phosphatidyltransferase family protein [Myxococcaceae bacterium]